MWLQEGDILDIDGKRFVVISISSDDRVHSDDDTMHPWIERLTLMQIRRDRKAS